VTSNKFDKPELKTTLERAIADYIKGGNEFPTGVVVGPDLQAIGREWATPHLDLSGFRHAFAFEPPNRLDHVRFENVALDFDPRNYSVSFEGRLTREGERLLRGFMPTDEQKRPIEQSVNQADKVIEPTAAKVGRLQHELYEVTDAVNKQIERFKAARQEASCAKEELNKLQRQRNEIAAQLAEVFTPNPPGFGYAVDLMERNR
jgi:hypothetical protein